MPYKNRDEANARLRERYANDPEWHAKELARAAIRRAKVVADPEKHRKRKEQALENHRKNKERNNARSSAWNKAHPEQRKANKRAWNERNKERLHAQNAAYRARPEKKLLRYLAHLLAKYGLSEQGFYDVLQEQHGLCKNPSCQIRLDDKTRDSKVNVDHDHETGEVRGVLCNSCNTSLGIMREHKAKILGLAKLLEK